MDDAQIDDLKQFITATVSQSEARIMTNLGDRIGGVEKRLGSLEQKVDDGFAGIAEALEAINDRDAETDQRLTRLEQKAA